VEPVAPPPTHDPDLDPPHRAASDGRPPFLPQEYQRLVANPFLALVGLIAWFAAIRWALASRNDWLLALAVAGLVAPASLLHYHCLDCGATGILFRWKSHACDRVRARQRIDQVRHFRGPNPDTQTILWGYLVAIVAILAFVVSRAIRFR
jgi:hypothetical protein